ncbi:MAG: single-stranded DNA-binding protein [Thermoguttaceae bacterium]|nr:single-stranded DNA-binding protein [Thermoguttaceae bacterium]MBQ3333645.1 single-stranded DNA-binding protein [Thermoguttaceae bacterium]MBQ6620745.1 single-stranded DNA-binding protein [Thermoguttaceae bacterium]MBR2585829.1 single-stranded DNA-binding protein [Thermoguttaceae bacterium]
MASYNKVVLVGNVTRDPEIRFLPSGNPVCDCGLAVNDRRKNSNGEMVEDTVFVDVTLWGRTAEVASQYAKKGTPILIDGRLKLDSWEVDGQTRTKLKVVGERLVLLGSGSRQQGGDAPQRSYQSNNYGAPRSYQQNQQTAGYQQDYPNNPPNQGQFDPPSDMGGDDIPF